MNKHSVFLRKLQARYSPRMERSGREPCPRGVGTERGASTWPNKALSRAAGVDGDDGAGDALRLVAEQEFDRVGDVVQLGEAMERAAAHDLLEMRLAKALGHLGIE